MLGAELVRRRSDGSKAVGRIVEVEAYIGPEDLACHASKGRTARTEVIGPPGHAYVYLIYGMHNCFNVVTGPEGLAAAVLVRALEPIAGVGASTRGPGRLCKALDIDRTLNGANLCDPGIFLRPGHAPRRIAAARSHRGRLRWAAGPAGASGFSIPKVPGFRAEGKIGSDRRAR